MSGIWYTFTDKIHLYIEKISRCYSGCKVLWSDYDIDYSYLLILIEWKLERMEKRIKRGNHVGCEKDAWDIHVTRLILKRIIDDDYINEDYAKDLREYFNKKFVPTGSGLFKKRLDRHMKRSEQLREQDWVLFNKMFSRKMRKWWT